MNNKIVILISVTITIAIIAFSITQMGIIGEKPGSNMEESNPVNAMLEKIKEDKINNDQSDEPYYPKEREWVRSGPFLMDRSEYILGEKIFLNIENLDKNIKGAMIFSKIHNSTHNQEYRTIYFDGSKPQQNFYLAMYPSIAQGFCTSDELVGDWELILAGTEFENFKFKILDKIMPGAERSFVSVC